MIESSLRGFVSAALSISLRRSRYESISRGALPTNPETNDILSLSGLLPSPLSLNRTGYLQIPIRSPNRQIFPVGLVLQSTTINEEFEYGSPRRGTRSGSTTFKYGTVTNRAFGAFTVAFASLVETVSVKGGASARMS